MTTKRVVVVHPDLGVGGGGGGGGVGGGAERLIVDASKNTEPAEAEKNNKSLVAGDEAAAVHRGFQTMLEGDLYCAICREIYINPQILNCAHSFCKFCLDEWLSKKYGCPSCRMVVVFQTENLALKNIINKMVSTSSKEFQNEREAALDQRSKAESQQKTNGVQPRMEHRSFFSDGRAKPMFSRNHIRPWRGPNGATIWQTKVDKTGKVIAVDTENFSSSSEEEDDDNDDEGDDDNDGDVEIYDNDYFSNGSDSDISYVHEYMPGAEFIDLDDADEDDEIEVMESSDESATSTVNMDSSSDDDNNSYVAARRRRMNDLNILAGNIDADDDESWEPRADRSSDSMEAVETESEEESGLEIFGMLARAPILDSTDSDTSSESNSDDDDDDDDDPVPIEFEETTEDEDDSTSESCDHADDDDDSELY